MKSDFLSRLSSTEQTDQRGTGEQCLRFHLVPDTTALLPVHQLTEVLTIPIGKIMPIPHMNAWVMGVYNWRGEILWMVDLGQLFGLTPWCQQVGSASAYKAMVLRGRSSSQMLGLVVNRVEDIEWCDLDLIQAPPSSGVPPELAPFLRGYWLQSSGEMLSVFDGHAIFSAMPQP